VLERKMEYTDLSQCFTDIFGPAAQYDCFQAFQEDLCRFQEVSGSILRVKNSSSVAKDNKRRKTTVPDRMQYSSITYCCIHFGQPKIRSKGLRPKQRYLPCGCQFFITASYSYKLDTLLITKKNLIHNHNLDMDMAKLRAKNRHRDVNQLKEVNDVFQINPSLVGPYLLKKETHCITVLDQLLRDDTYTDVTLTAEGQSLKAHRVVLCLASPYFCQVLSRELNMHCVVLLGNVKFSELRNIIRFIYTGEATVDASELESFMRIAEMLEISSLCDALKCISDIGIETEDSFSSEYSISGAECLAPAKRPRSKASPVPCKMQKVSGKEESSRCSSVLPVVSGNLLSVKNEQSGFVTATTFRSKSGSVVKEETLLNNEHGNEGPGGIEKLTKESSGSAEELAAIVRDRKMSSDVSGGNEDPFPTAVESQMEETIEDNVVNSDPDTLAVPGRCPHCPDLPQRYESGAMISHLATHPYKPAYPCDYCWCVFVKSSNFKAHVKNCQPSL
ncbi:hypothetical protein OTU49_011986, partial [Cherax quadricarinatus]